MKNIWFQMLLYMRGVTIYTTVFVSEKIFSSLLIQLHTISCINFLLFGQTPN